MSKPTKQRRSFRLNKGNLYWAYLKTQNKRKRCLEEPIEDLEPSTQRRSPTKLEFMAYLGLMPTKAAESAEYMEYMEPWTEKKELETHGNEATNPEERKMPDRTEAVKEIATTPEVAAHNIVKENPPEPQRKKANRKMTPYSAWEEHNYVKWKK